MPHQDPVQNQLHEGSKPHANWAQYQERQLCMEAIVQRHEEEMLRLEMCSQQGEPAPIN